MHIFKFFPAFFPLIINDTLVNTVKLFWVLLMETRLTSTYLAYYCSVYVILWITLYIAFTNMETLDNVGESSQGPLAVVLVSLLVILAVICYVALLLWRKYLE